jgi:hypothetical protein
MTFKNTHRYIRRLADLTSFGTIAQITGKTTDTAEAWGRAPESIENPTGTGKHNPFDTVLRIIGRAHEKSPALAREMGEMFPDYVNYLDGKARRPAACLNELIGSSVREHSDVIVNLLNCPEPNFAAVHTEIKEAIIALERLDNYVIGEMKEQTLKAVS